jgi:Mycobacterial cell wall arabinan synthesis protein/EmbC C-terminal domain/Arabinosyltransferase concanavalin like domain
VLAALAALAFPFAPVHQDLTRVSWPAAGPGTAPAAVPVAVPLMPYQPSSMRSTFSCATVAALAVARPAGATVLATTVDGSDTAWPLRYGLTVRVVDGHLIVNVGERTVLARPLDPGTDGSCQWLLESSAARTEVRRDGTVVASVAGDVRPQVAALLSDAPAAGAPIDGLSVQLTADSRFQTTIGPIKLALAVIAVLALAVALGMVWRADRGAVSAHRVRLTHGRAWLPQPADGAVLAVLTVWTLIGPITVDDGYISGIVRGRDLNGYIGNYYHWFNAPEAPFGWFYELYHLWFELGTAPLWLRVPSAVLGMLCWLLLSRLVLPRLGPVLRSGRGAVWVAAAVFLTWWLAFAIGLRPEPWVAVGTLVVFCLVERGLATRRLLPLVVGLLVAGLTLAVTPTGVIAFAPYLASLRPLLRLARTRTDLAWAPLVAVTVAAGAAPLVVMFADQTFGAVVEAIRVRTRIGPYVPWNQEIDRYSRLLEPTLLEGSLSRRVPVLFMLLALVVVGWQVRRGRLRGVHRGAAARLLVTIALGLAAFVFTPTKWTQHFGAFAGLGTAATVLGLRAITGDVIRTAQARAAGIAVVAAVGGLALSGRNNWPYVSDYDLTWHDVPPILLDIPIGTIMLYGGLALAIAVGLVAVWRETAGNRTWVVRWIPPPAPLVMAVIVLTLVIELGTFVKVTIERRDTYTLAADSRAALSGDGCGLASFLRVEPDPWAGVLSPLPGAAGEAGLDGFTAVASGHTPDPGYGLPGWHAERSNPPATMRTGWYALPPELREGTLPVVVSVDRRLTPHSSLTVELGRTTAAGTVEVLAQVPLNDAGGDVGSVGDIGGGQQDRRVLVPSLAPGADAVRVLAVSSGGITFAVPRAPRVIALLDAVPPTATVVADWPVSYLFPCYRLPSLANGLDELPDYRIGPPRFDDPSAGITYAHDHGGPLASARSLVREERLPLYLVGDPLRDAAQLYRWVLVRPLGQPSITLERHTVPGWWRGPHITIPVDASLDPGRRGSS